jgi:RND family efflux transporter MFP subunit
MNVLHTHNLKFAAAAVASLLFAAAGQAQQMPPPAVVLAEAQYSMLAPAVNVPGTVQSRNNARLASELSARLTWIAEVGTRVKAGDAVARLDDTTFRLAEMEAASRVRREQARVQFLQSEVERLQRLAERNNTARSQLDQTVSDLAVAQSEEEIAEAQLGLAKVAVAITEIRAPFDGIVTERLRNAGERLNVADEVVRLVDPGSIEVVARAPLNTVNFVNEGDELALHNDYREGSGVVRTIVPVGNPQSHMFEVRLDVDPERWTVGESVRLSMPTAIAREVLTVPRDALVLRREGSFVFRIDDEGVAEQVNVVTGLGAGELMEVIGALEPGDQVVIRGAERLSTGMTVSINRTTGSGSAAANP